jgi:hypothetical protein
LSDKLKILSQDDTSVKILMNGYLVKLNFLRQKNDRIIDEVKNILTASFAETEREGGEE